jgi:hypothetical protein
MAACSVTAHKASSDGWLLRSTDVVHLNTGKKLQEQELDSDGTCKLGGRNKEPNFFFSPENKGY